MIYRPPDACICCALHDKENPFHNSEKKKMSEYKNNNQNVALTSPSGHLPSPTISLIITILKHFIEENSLSDSS